MQWIEEAILTLFRNEGLCDWCMLPCKQRDPHHTVIRRGTGGGSRIDLAINLTALCHGCHLEHHAGHAPLKCDLMAVIAAREKIDQQTIKDVLRAIRDAPRSWSREEGRAVIAEIYAKWGLTP